MTMIETNEPREQDMDSARELLMDLVDAEHIPSPEELAMQDRILNWTLRIAFVAGILYYVADCLGYVNHF